MSDSKLLRGTMILTASIFISKIIGLIYIFPFTAIVGSVGLALYTYGYVPYTVVLSIATLGVPLAVSKFVSKYNALGDYRTGRRLFKSGLIVMSITGFIAFLILFLLATPIAHHVVEGKDLKGNTIEDVILTIRMVSTALLIVPVMSIIRGYFQGHQSMGPTAISQVIEQVVRIVFILSVTFAIVNVMEGSISLAVGFATFGAFVGALGGLAVLLFYWFKRKKYLDEQLRLSTAEHDISLVEMYKELLMYALPISFIGLAIPLYQLIDMATFTKALELINYSQGDAEAAFGLFAQAAHKLILIPVSIATALSLTLLPTITKSFVDNNRAMLQKQITQTYQVILFLTLPAALGLSILSRPAFAALFGLNDLMIGAEILKYYAPVAVLFSLFAVTSAILQGISQQRFAVIGLVAGVSSKLMLNSLLIVQFEAIGAIYATAIGYAIAVAINFWAIGKYAEYNYRYIVKRFLLISIFASAMGVVVLLFQSMLTQIFPFDHNRPNAFVVLMVSVMAGGVSYLYLGVRSNLAGQILGQRFKFLKKKVKNEQQKNASE